MTRSRCTVKQKSLLIDEFVNCYRHTWGSNEGLSSARLKKMSCRTLRQNIRSLKDFPTRRR